MAKQASDDENTGLHEAKPRAEIVRQEDYPERPYSEAMTNEQKEALQEHGLL